LKQKTALANCVFGMGKGAAQLRGEVTPAFSNGMDSAERMYGEWFCGRRRFGAEANPFLVDMSRRRCDGESRAVESPNANEQKTHHAFDRRNPVRSSNMRAWKFKRLTPSVSRPCREPPPSGGTLSMRSPSGWRQGTGFPLAREWRKRASF
jgi:hypothetical protein